MIVDGTTWEGGKKNPEIWLTSFLNGPSHPHYSPEQMLPVGPVAVARQRLHGEDGQQRDEQAVPHSTGTPESAKRHRRSCGSSSPVVP